MTYQLRQRPDGQIEIVVHRPTVIGVMSDHDMAQRFVAFLNAEAPDLVEEATPSLEPAAADVSDAAAAQDNAAALRDPGAAAKSLGEAKIGHVPAVLDRPSPPARLPATVPAGLSEAAIEAALKRVSTGEKLSDVARDVGIAFASLRGHWAAHCRHLQKHIAEGGQEQCTLCHKPFTPSVTNPDKCARCAQVVT